MLSAFDTVEATRRADLEWFTWEGSPRRRSSQRTPELVDLRIQSSRPLEFSLDLRDLNSRRFRASDQVLK